jgi:hypothetical protein
MKTGVVISGAGVTEHDCDGNRRGGDAIFSAFSCTPFTSF